MADPRSAPQLGTLTWLPAADHPDLHLVVYTPVDDGCTPARLAALLYKGECN